MTTDGRYLWPPMVGRYESVETGMAAVGGT
jgi:hypothetical protein